MEKSRIKYREKKIVKESKNYHDVVLLNTLKYLVLLALTALFIAVFMSLAKSNFNINQKEVVVKIDIENKVNICSPDDDQVKNN
jgi:sensor domain CHASE-containing protein